MTLVEGDVQVLNGHPVAVDLAEAVEGNAHWQVREVLAGLGRQSTVAWGESLGRVKTVDQKDVFWQDTDVSRYGLSSQTFALFVHKDGVVLVHDVVEEESPACAVFPGAAAQISPEGSFEGEVPRRCDAVFSCKLNFLENREKKK